MYTRRWSCWNSTLTLLKDRRTHAENSCMVSGTVLLSLTMYTGNTHCHWKQNAHALPRTHTRVAPKKRRRPPITTRITTHNAYIGYIVNLYFFSFASVAELLILEMSASLCTDTCWTTLLTHLTYLAGA